MARNALENKIKEWKEKEEKLVDVDAKYGNIQRLFENMPPKLWNAIDAFSKGKDWESEVKTESVDFTKEAKDYSEKILVDAMFPGEISDDDWAEYKDEEGDNSIKRLVQSKINDATKAFEKKKEEVKSYSDQQVLDAKEKQQKYLDSAEASKQKFIERYTDADAATIENLHSKFTKTGLQSVFFNQDGSVKEDAYLRLAMAEYGAELIDQYKAIAERKVQTETIQDVLLRTADTPPATKGSGASVTREEVRPEVQAEIERIQELR